MVFSYFCFLKSDNLLYSSGMWLVLPFPSSAPFCYVPGEQTPFKNAWTYIYICKCVYIHTYMCICICIYSLHFCGKIYITFINLTIVLKRFYLFIFRERGREGEREGEKQQCEREATIASHTRQACVLTGN